MIHLKSILIFAFLVFAVALFAAKSPHGRSLKMDCNVCHTTSGWTEINETGFNHNATRFQLKGQHKLVKCKECHLDLVFENAKTTCNSCHQDVHEQTLGVDCDRCHNDNSWLVNNIKQLHQASSFPLSGVHATVECNECHISSSDLRFDKMGNDCFSCHRDDFQATVNPNHAAAGFSINCTECHNQNATNWSGPIYDHSFFPLTNAHKLDCKSCHASGVYKGLPSTCESCHLTDYNTTTNPNHQQAGYSKDCQTCHTTSTWTGAAVDHSFFPLTNGHQLSCTECHTNGTYQGLQNDCNSCHNKDYAATTNPNHTQAGYTTDCKTCHNTTNWTEATQDHSFFPLTNAHKLDCKSCHASGVYKGLPSTCQSCHLPEYNAATNPPHLSAGYSKECQLCHNTNFWTDANLNHDAAYFPIYSGSHKGEWSKCTDCHTNASNYNVFTCTNCHEHSKSEMDDEHDEVNNYVYNSANCYACHPRGKS